jgi:hypothetical protein
VGICYVGFGRVRSQRLPKFSGNITDEVLVERLSEMFQVDCGLRVRFHEWNDEKLIYYNIFRYQSDDMIWDEYGHPSYGGSQFLAGEMGSVMSAWDSLAIFK